MASRLGEQVAQHAGAHQRVLDLEQVRRQQDDAALGAVQQRAQVMHAAKADVVLLAEKLVGLVGLREPLLDRMQVVAGQERGRDLGAAGKGAVGGEAFEDFCDIREHAVCVDS